MKCPNCGEECECDEVDIGVGMQQCGPWGCPNCHWVQDVSPILADIGQTGTHHGVVEGGKVVVVTNAPDGTCPFCHQTSIMNFGNCANCGRRRTDILDDF